MPLSDAQVIDVAEKAAVKAVKATLLMIGIDVDNPLEAQKDFVIMREVGKIVTDPEFRADIEHTRRWRKAMETIGTKGFLTAAGVVLSGALAIFWMGLKAYFGKG